jgi:hypothetical protein
MSADTLRRAVAEAEFLLREARVEVTEATEVIETLQVQGAMGLAYRADAGLREHLAQMSPDMVSRLSTAAAVLVRMTGPGSAEPRAVLADPAASAGALARRFHDTYERLVREHGYVPREATAEPWDEVPKRNRALMTAVFAEFLVWLADADDGRLINGVNMATMADGAEEPPASCGRPKESSGSAETLTERGAVVTNTATLADTPVPRFVLPPGAVDTVAMVDKPPASGV